MEKYYIFEVAKDELSSTEKHGVYDNKEDAVNAAWDLYTKSMDNIFGFENDVVNFCELKREEYMATSDTDVNVLIENDIKNIFRELINSEERFRKGYSVHFLNYLKNLFESTEKGVTSENGYYNSFTGTSIYITKVDPSLW